MPMLDAFIPAGALSAEAERALLSNLTDILLRTEGQFDAERRQAMVEEVTEAVLDAEHGAYERNPFRVWVFANEIPDGTWGGGGRIFHFADIAGFVIGDAECGRAYAERRLADRDAAEAGVDA